MHEMTTSGRVLAISRSDACLFSNDEAISGLGDEALGVVMTMTGLRFIRTERYPADTLVCLELLRTRCAYAQGSMTILVTASFLSRQILYISGA
jgi:hypothetical protein